MSGENIRLESFPICNRCSICHDCTIPCPKPTCPAPFIIASQGGYITPHPDFTRSIKDCWIERRYGILWWFIILIFTMAAIALFLGFLFLAVKSFILIISYGLMIQSALVPLGGVYFASDERIYNSSMAEPNTTFVHPSYNTSKALENVCGIPIRNVRWTNDWFMIVNQTAAIDVNFGTMNEAPEIQAFFAPDIVNVLPQALFEIDEFPKVGKVLNISHDHLKTVCLERMVIELWAAVQELKKRVESCNCI